MKCIQHILGFALIITANMSFAADSFPYHESFESSFGRWTTGASSDFPWSRNSGPTTSYNTGPSQAHDRDWYIYTEASYPNFLNKTAIIEAQFDISSLTTPYFSFYYHKHGDAMGPLFVEVDNGSGWVTVLSLYGAPQPADYTPWSRGDIDLAAYAGATSLKIRFRGKTGGDFRSDMCVDDIWIYDKSVMPHHFVWSPIPEIQTDGEPIPVQVTAVNVAGQTVTTFNEAVGISGWSAGFPDAVSNGDFATGDLSSWTTMGVGPTPGPYLIMPSILFSSRNAVRMQPDSGVDGISQDIFMREGETYYLSAYFSVENTIGVDFTNSIHGRIRIDGTDIYSVSIPGVSATSARYAFLWGAFIPPADGTYSLQLISHTSTTQNNFLYSYFENVTVTFSPAQYINATPSMTGQFVNGVWSGSVTVAERVPDIRLYARYAYVSGESGIFSTFVSAVDLDRDGMRDDWEETYFPSTAACDPAEDDDDDGYINSEEYIIGSNPMQKSSHLALTGTLTGDDKCIINWFSADNRRYDIQWTPDLIFQPFSDLATEIPHTQGAYTNDISGYNKGFYKMKVRY